MAIRQPIITVLGHIDHGKCVAKGTNIFLADGKIDPVEEIFEKELVHGKSIVDEDGLIIELKDPIFVLGEEKNQIKKFMVTHLWKLKKDTLVKIQTENGFEIETTPEHPFPVLNEKFGISYVRASDLSENQFICVPKSLPIEVQNSLPVKERILECLKNSDFLVFIRKSFSQHVKILANINSYSMHYDDFYNNRLRISDFLALSKNHFNVEQIFDEIESVKQSTRKWRAGHSSKKIRLPKTDEELKNLFCFAGLFFGDGDNHSGKLTNNDFELLEFYKQFAEKTLGINCIIQKGHTSMEAFPKGGKTLVRFLQAVFEICPGKKSAHIQIPKVVMVAPNSFVSKFIQGYFDADGYVDSNNGLEITSNSKKMLEGLAFLLLRFNIRCFLRKNKNAYRLTIKGTQNVQNFAKYINFSLPTKKAKLEKYLQIAGTSRVLDSTPIGGKNIREVRKKFGIGNKRLKIPYLENTESYAHVSMNFLQKFEKILKKTIEECGKTYDNDSLNLFSNLDSLINGSLGFSRIAKKEFIKNEYGFVFDLTQPKTHNFVANGLLVHNTTFLDRIRGTTIAGREAGSITQHIGATEVPIGTIKKISGKLLEKYGFALEIPGLLFIDTPGHEAFINLRKRGGSIADLAVVIIDASQGIQQQTIEAIEILRSFRTPFILGLNKIDKIHGYEPSSGSFSENIKNQPQKTQKELDEKLYIIVGKMHELGFQSERFDRCENFAKQIAIVPLSAKTGEGIPECLMLLAGLSQKFLKEKLEIHESQAGKGNVLEVREEKGLGKTIDVILFDGVLSVNEKIVLAGKHGIIETKIRALLKPKPLDEIRDSRERFQNMQKVFAASGVKIAAPGLDEALAGSPLLALKTGKEHELVSREIKGIVAETQSVGPIIKADTLGALEATALLLESQLRMKPRKTDIGDVTRKDIIEAYGIKNEQPFKGVIFAFNVKVDEAALEEAKKKGIKIFTGNVIYRLLEDYAGWEKHEKEKEKTRKLASIACPGKIQLLPNHVFRKSKPAIVGVRVVAGKIRHDLQLMKANGTRIGKIVAIQSKSISLQEAKAGEEVAISISDAVIGRNLEEEETLYTFIPPKGIAELEKSIDLFSQEEKELLEEIRIIEAKTTEEVTG